MTIEISENGVQKTFFAEIFEEDDGRLSGHARIEFGDAVSFQGRTEDELREHFLAMRAAHLADRKTGPEIGSIRGEARKEDVDRRVQ